jgi:subtilisin family serine protease
LLVKLRPSTTTLQAAESRANLRPLFDVQLAAPTTFGIDSTPRWFLADLPDGAETPWDLAHARVAEQLGVSESDVIFAEPDIVHSVYQDTNEVAADRKFAMGDGCQADPQDGTRGKVLGPDEFAWHLGDDYTQLRKAREAVEFTDPRTRIAHLDTGYYRAHDTTPENVLRSLERNFVAGDADPSNAEDPDNRVLIIDNSGHGTGTIGILAGKAATAGGIALGGAPGAEVLPLRISDRVVLIRTSALSRRSITQSSSTATWSQ